MSSSFAWSRNVFSSWSRNVFSPCFRLLLAPHPLVGAMFASILCVAPADGRERFVRASRPPPSSSPCPCRHPRRALLNVFHSKPNGSGGSKLAHPPVASSAPDIAMSSSFRATADFLLHCYSTLNPMPVESEIWKRCPASVTFTFSPCPLCPPAGERGSLSCACTRDFFRLRLEPSSPPLLWQAQTLAHAARRLRRVRDLEKSASSSLAIANPCACYPTDASVGFEIWSGFRLRLRVAPHPLVGANLAVRLLARLLLSSSPPSRASPAGGRESCRFAAHVVFWGELFLCARCFPPPPTHDFLSPSLRHLLPSLPDARVESEFWKSFRLHFTPHPLVGVSLAARCAVRRLRVVPRVRPLTRSSSFLLPVLTLHWVRMRRRCVPHGALPRFHFRRFSRIAPAVVRCVRFAAHVVLGGSCFSAHVVSLPSPIHRTFTRGLAATRRVAAISFAPTSWSF